MGFKTEFKLHPPYHAETVTLKPVKGKWISNFGGCKHLSYLMHSTLKQNFPLRERFEVLLKESARSLFLSFIIRSSYSNKNGSTNLFYIRNLAQYLGLKVS